MKMLICKLVLVLFCWTSVTHSAPPLCEQLMQPAHDLEPGHLTGTRALIGGSVSVPSHLKKFRLRDSGFISFSGNTNGTHLSWTRGVLINGVCLNHTEHITLNQWNFTFDGTAAKNLSGEFVHTSCKDCLLVKFIEKMGQRTHLSLFSRRRSLSQAEMQEFEMQVQCHQMPPPAIMDPTKDLCMALTPD